MALPAFNGETLKGRLNKMDKKRQLACGATCCERLLPNYLAFQQDTGWGDISPIRNALNLVWSFLEDCQLPNAQEIRKITAHCEFVIPDSEKFESLYVSSAQDACFAVCNLLDFMIDSDVDKIVLAARYATDSVDLYVQELENMEPNTSELEQKILTHKLMQRELTKQEDDLRAIEKTSSLDSNFLTQLRSSWNNNGKSNLDLP